jgi:hypothetical protein
MSTKPVSAAKTGLFIRGAHAAETTTLSAYDALTGWVQVKGITNIGEFGATFQEITSEPLEAEATGKYKGMRNDGSLALTMERVPDDEGQQALIEALQSYDSFDFMVALNDKPAGATSKPTRLYFPGKVLSYTTNVGGANNLVTASCTISIDGAVVEGASVTGA